MATPKPLLPDCGLYRTTRPLPEREDEVVADMLVYFHNHSDSGLPVVIVPEHNVNNRWHFHGAGVVFRGMSWADSLVKLPSEGFYVLRRALPFDEGEWAKGTLVQLGYTRKGEAIVFIAQLRARLQENDLFFADRGVSLDRSRLSLLEPVHIFVEPAAPGAHTTGVH